MTTILMTMTCIISSTYMGVVVITVVAVLAETQLTLPVCPQTIEGFRIVGLRSSELCAVGYIEPHVSLPCPGPE